MWIKSSSAHLSEILLLYPERIHIHFPDHLITFEVMGARANPGASGTGQEPTQRRILEDLESWISL